jgi:hypothetical protein
VRWPGEACRFKLPRSCTDSDGGGASLRVQPHSEARISQQLLEVALLLRPRPSTHREYLTVVSFGARRVKMRAVWGPQQVKTGRPEADRVGGCSLKLQ